MYAYSMHFLVNLAIVSRLYRQATQALREVNLFVLNFGEFGHNSFARHHTASL